MDSNIPPLLCCIGEEASGHPTHFMMERAFGATDVDWRVLTISVATSQLETALAGASVMGFNALRFTGQWCAAVAMLANSTPSDRALGTNTDIANDNESVELASEPPDAVISCPRRTSFIGSLTSASLQGNGFSAWHNQGHGLLNILGQSNVPTEHTQLWLHGDSTLTRSAFAAIEFRKPRMLCWSNAPDEIVAANIQNEESELLTSNSDINLTEVFEPSHPIAVVGEFTDEQQELADTSLVYSSLFLARAADIQFNNPALAAARITSKAELTVASERYDFARWTREEVDRDILRDAYDEYCDF